jgi:hypothetical protein
MLRRDRGESTAMRCIARLFAYGLLAIAATLGNAAAQTIGALSATEIERALSDAGYSPRIFQDPNSQDQTVQNPFFGGTMFLSGGTEIVFYVRTSGCAGEPAACEHLIFYANFDLDRDVTPDDLRAANGFNDTRVFGRSYVLEADKQVGIDYLIDVGGGVTRDHLAKGLTRWPDIVQEFIDSFTAENRQ